LNTRIFAFVPKQSKSAVKHTVGVLGTWPSGTEPLPQAALVIIDETSEGTFLIRYSSDGEFAGDTWHENRDEAQDQAAFEFGEVKWQESPATPEDLREFAVARLQIGPAKKPDGGLG